MGKLKVVENKKMMIIGIAVVAVLAICLFQSFGKNDDKLFGVDHGSVKNNVYTSEALNLTFKAPEGFELQSDKELDEIMGFVSENDEDMKEKLELLKKAGYFEMAAYHESGASVNVLLGDAALTGRYGYKEDKKKVDGFLTGARQGIEEKGCTLINEGETTLAGSKFYKLESTLDYEGLKLLVNQYVGGSEKYSILISVIAFADDPTVVNQIEDAFQKIQK